MSKALASKRNINVMRAAILCKEEKFQTFLRTTYPRTWSGSLGEGDTQAAYAMRTILAIGSRKELETNERALKRFDALVAKYEMWKKGE